MIHGIIINFLRGDYHIVLRKLRKVFRGKLSWKLEIILKYFGKYNKYVNNYSSQPLGFPSRPDPRDLLMTESRSTELRFKVGYVNCLCISHYHRAVWRQCRFSKDLMNKQPATAGGVIYIVNAYMCIINMHLYVFK